jgi:hypothetical protein
MLGFGLIVFIFQEMKEIFREVTRNKVERNEEQGEHDNLYILDPKEN